MKFWQSVCKDRSARDGDCSTGEVAALYVVLGLAGLQGLRGVRGIVLTKTAGVNAHAREMQLLSRKISL